MNDEQTPSALIKPKQRFSTIWILPIVAAFIGIGMIYHHYQNRGIDIVIVFDNALGLETQNTRLKYRNVDIGLLKSINFTDDGESIEAVVEIEKDMQDFLRSDSQFWVVRPRVGTGGVSGFSTLLSGAYITVDPGKSQDYSRRFMGLENPPISSPTSQGIKLKLHSEGGKSVNVGDPVLYRGFQVGAVEKVEFDLQNRRVAYEIFIQAPYDSLVTTNTFFWNTGGLTVNATPNGVTIDLASIESLVSGGIQFDIPEDLGIGERIEQPRDFKLYSSRASIDDDRVYEYLEYVILVEDSVGGLSIGAPVEYRGILIGRVHRPYLGFYQTQQINIDETRIPVVIHLEPARLAPNNEYNLEWFDNQFNEWIKSGLTASVETANYLTGSLKVSLDLSEDMRSEIEYFGKYTVIPVGQSGFANIMSKTDQLLTKLNNLPLTELLLSTQQTINSANQTFRTANDSVLAASAVLVSVEQTLEQAQNTLEGLQPNSQIYRKLEHNLQEMQQTLNMMQPFLQEIRKKPNSLIFSQPPVQDIEPQGSKRP